MIEKTITSRSSPCTFSRFFTKTGSCISLVEEDCVAIRGLYQGDGVDCGTDDVVCPTACPADSDGNRRVDVADIVILLADWGPCPE